MGDLPEAFDAAAVYIEVEVDEVECFEDVADAATAIEVKGAVEDDVFCLEGISGGYEADHAVGYGDAIVVGWVDGVGLDGPGGGGSGACGDAGG
jgi:hypothetical protein